MNSDRLRASQSLFSSDSILQTRIGSLESRAVIAEATIHKPRVQVSRISLPATSSGNRPGAADTIQDITPHRTTPRQGSCVPIRSPGQYKSSAGTVSQTYKHSAAFDVSKRQQVLQSSLRTDASFSCQAFEVQPKSRIPRLASTMSISSPQQASLIEISRIKGFMRLNGTSASDERSDTSSPEGTTGATDEDLDEPSSVIESYDITTNRQGPVWKDHGHDDAMIKLPRTEVISGLKDEISNTLSSMKSPIIARTGGNELYTTRKTHLALRGCRSITCTTSKQDNKSTSLVQKMHSMFNLKRKFAEPEFIMQQKSLDTMTATPIHVSASKFTAKDSTISSLRGQASKENDLKRRHRYLSMAKALSDSSMLAKRAHIACIAAEAAAFEASQQASLAQRAVLLVEASARRLLR